MLLRIVLFAIAALLLGAHYYRAGNLLLVAFCLASPLLFFHKRRRSLILLQALAYGAAAIWVEAAIRLVEFRQQMGRPWMAAAIILGAVALLTLAAGLLLNSRAIAQRYPV
jgi:lysylphosphatidylglycerol synthetase-like protein (DUF2156 family)